MIIARAIVYLFIAYAAAGVLFAVYFTIFSVRKFDPAASDAGAGFRLMIIPGVSALWPLMLFKLLKGRSRRSEENENQGDPGERKG